MNTVQPIRDLAKIGKIKRTLRKRTARDYMLFVMGINTALRVGDLLDLNVSDVIDDDGNVVDFIGLTENKTGKFKRLKINESAKEAIAFFVDEQNPDRSEPLFRSPRTGKAISRVQVWRLLEKWASEVGIKDAIGAHSLRKTWGYQARQQGISLKLIQKKLGHATPDVTCRYIGITADEIEEVEDSVSL